MPDPNTEHGLRVQLATALRERDEAREEADKQRARRNICQQDRNAYELQNDGLRAEVQRLRERDDAARSMLTQLRAALDEDTTFLGAVLRVEMDKWLGAGGDRG